VDIDIQHNLMSSPEKDGKNTPIFSESNSKHKNH